MRNLAKRGLFLVGPGLAMLVMMAACGEVSGQTAGPVQPAAASTSTTGPTATNLAPVAETVTSVGPASLANSTPTAIGGPNEAIPATNIPNATLTPAVLVTASLPVTVQTGTGVSGPAQTGANGPNPTAAPKPPTSAPPTPTAQPIGNAALNGSVRGRVVASPGCPGPVRAGSPCPPRPVAGRDIAVIDQKGTTVKTVTTDAQGYFQLNLGSGNYRLELVAPPGQPDQGRTRQVSVNAGQVVNLEIEVDSGIR